MEENKKSVETKARQLEDWKKIKSAINVMKWTYTRPVHEMSESVNLMKEEFKRNYGFPFSEGYFQDTSL